MTERLAIVSDGLVVRYGSVEAVHDATFAVRDGEIFGLLGPNGAGKTSVIRVLTTLIRPAAGRVRVLGCDVAQAPASVRQITGYVPQVLSADGWMSGRENLLMLADLHLVPWRSRRVRVDDVLELMGLGQVGDDLVMTYSGGMVRRLELAGALLSSPRLLLLDEPTLGLDPLARRVMWEHLRGIRDEHGTTILATTHYLEEAAEHCERVAVMGGGRVLAEGTPSDLQAGVGGDGGTLEDVFVAIGADHQEQRGGLREIARVRRTARRLG